MPSSKLIANHIATIDNEMEKAKQAKRKNKEEIMHRKKSSRFREE